MAPAPHLSEEQLMALLGIPEVLPCEISLGSVADISWIDLLQVRVLCMCRSCARALCRCGAGLSYAKRTKGLAIFAIFC
jgi:hypothetical protein